MTNDADLLTDLVEDKYLVELKHSNRRFKVDCNDEDTADMSPCNCHKCGGGNTRRRGIKVLCVTDEDDNELSLDSKICKNIIRKVQNALFSGQAICVECENEIITELRLSSK